MCHRLKKNRDDHRYVVLTGRRERHRKYLLDIR
jgi:hypothetical protein